MSYILYAQGCGTAAVYVLDKLHEFRPVRLLTFLQQLTKEFSKAHSLGLCMVSGK